jgi:serine protease AprX
MAETDLAFFGEGVRGMRKAIIVLVTGLLVAGLAVQPASAAPRSRSAQRGSSGRLADANANRISDAFEPALDAAATDDRFDVVVTYAGPGTAASAQRDVGPFRVTHEYRIVHGFAATMSAGQIRNLARNPNVRRIEQDVRVRLTLDASRRDFGVDHARADYPAVTGAGAAICILDTGIDANHEQFDSKSITFKDFVGSSVTAYDDHGHGTHVADIAAGDGTGGVNAPTFRGVAPGSALFVGKVLDGGGSGSDSGIIAGIQWCASQSAVRVISMSIGTIEASDGQDALSQAVNNAVAANGKVAVIAAGNSGDLAQSVGSPGAAANAITVGAVAEWSAPVNAGAGRHSDGVYLAPFSSRGPTLAGVTKPDVVAPGVTVTAAMANQSGGATYVTYSGTSMATPFVAGTAALALAANPSLTPSAVRSLIEGTAQDRGPAGKDNDWGAGLIDSYRVVATAAGASSPAPTAFPAWTRLNESVNRNGLWTYQFTVAADALGVPIAATIMIDGQVVCYYGCFFIEWSPDLDARLRDPNGIVLAESTCAAGDECGVGRQETVHAMPTVAGTYTLEVYPFSGSPNDGQGGGFSVDLSRGPAGAAPPPPPPTTPMHVGDLDRAAAAKKGGWTATVTIAAHDSSHAALSGVLVTGSWSDGTSGSCTTGAAGTCSVQRNLGKRATTITFTVSALSKTGYAYQPSSNHDPDGDSTGTAITVAKP